MTLFQKSFLLFVFSALAACGGGGGGGNDAPTASVDTPTVINAFDVRGSNTNNGVVGINPGIDEGRFSFRWNVSAETIYHVQLYVSEDAVISNQGDRRIFSRNCNVELSDCQSFAEEYPCNFTSENTILCGRPGNVIETNVAGFMNEIPKNAYLILKVCNGLFDKCDEEVRPVQFQ